MIEEAIIGALLLLDVKDRVEPLNEIKPEYFSDGVFREALRKLRENPAHDITTIGCDPYKIAKAVEHATYPHDIHTQISRLKEAYALRKLTDIATRLRKVMDVPRGIEGAISELMGLAAEVKIDKGELMEAFRNYDKYKNQEVLTFESYTLNSLTNGMRGGQVWVVGGKTGSGKSYFVLDAAIQQALAGKRVLFFSTELTDSENFRRFVLMYQYYMGEPDFDKAAEAATKLPIKLYTQISTSAGIEATIRADHAERPVDMVVIDHLQDIETGAEKEYDVIRRACMNIKNLAVQLNIPIILVSQLNRANQGKVSEMAFLGSGKIEQIAHVAIILVKRVDGNINLSIRKNRGGQTGSFPFRVKWPEGVFQPLD